jgi:CBS domain-containing protein
MTTAKDVMSRKPIACQETDSVYRAVEIMKRQNIGVIPIVDAQGRGSGIITDRDIALDIILRNLDPHSTQLREIMHTDLLTCRAEDDLNTVVEHMKRRQVKRILVTDEQDRFVGIISEADIARHTNRSVVGELAEGIYS